MLYACINPKSPFVDNKKLFGVKWIQFIDSGGQLQYHDILPLFIQDPMVTIFVLKLSEELSHHPTIEYYGADGKPVGKPYRSSLSRKQILQHCLGAIHSQDAHPLIIIVGTHRDALRWKFWKESIEEKNKQLQALLDSTHSTALYCGEGMKELIFAVNGLSPLATQAAGRALHTAEGGLPQHGTGAMGYTSWPIEVLLFYLEHIKGGGWCSAGRCSLGPSRDSGGQEQRLSPLQTGWLQGEDQLLWAPLYQVVCIIWDWGAYMYIAYKSKIINILITNAFKSQGPQIKVTCICMV